MFDYKEWINEITDYIDQETGTDNIIYGNYIEWDRFREAYGDELLLSEGVNYPGGND